MSNIYLIYSSTTYLTDSSNSVSINWEHWVGWTLNFLVKWTWKFLVNPAASKFSSRLNSIIFTVHASINLLLDALGTCKQTSVHWTQAKQAKGLTVQLALSKVQRRSLHSSSCTQHCSSTSNVGVRSVWPTCWLIHRFSFHYISSDQFWVRQQDYWLSCKPRR